jgi:hypothetical protein
MTNIKGPRLFVEEELLISKVLEDEFDTVLGVGGKHLAPKRALDYIISFLTLSFLSAALAGGGLLGLQHWDAGVASPEPVVEEEIVIVGSDFTIVDGTNTGIGLAVEKKLKELGWNVVSSTSLADLDPGLKPATGTLIFVTSEQYRPDAEALLVTFPSATIQVSSQFSTPVTVLIGTDHLG